MLLEASSAICKELAAIRATLESSTLPSNSSNPLINSKTLSLWLIKWLTTFKMHVLKPSTLRQYERIVKTIEKDSFGNLLLHKIESSDIQRYLTAITAPRQRQHTFGVLNGAFDKAHKMGTIPNNPCALVEIVNYDKRESKAFTAEEEVRFLKAAKGKLSENLFKFCLYFGLRKGEALALTGEDIQKKYIIVNKTLDDRNNVTPPKTKTSNRKIPILEQYQDFLDPFRKIKGRLFTSSGSRVQVHFVNICKKAKLKGFTIRSLRRTYGTRLAEQKVPTKVISKWLGHSNESIASEIYLHVNPDFEKSIVDSINTQFSRAVKDKT